MTTTPGMAKETTMMMPYGTTTLEWVEKHAEHLLAIGASTLYLDDADGPRPGGFRL